MRDSQAFCDVLAWSRREALPNIPIPLQAPDPDLVVDLAGIYGSTYDDDEYARSVDYGLTLEDWSEDDQAWADEFRQVKRVLRRGFRTKGLSCSTLWLSRFADALEQFLNKTQDSRVVLAHLLCSGVVKRIGCTSEVRLPTDQQNDSRSSE